MELLENMTGVEMPDDKHVLDLPKQFLAMLGVIGEKYENS
jgi:hypothetical protein